MNIELASLKQELIEVATATEIGFNCTPATKELIESIANKIEALTPTPAPTDRMDMVQGRWRLLYSTLALDPETTL